MNGAVPEPSRRVNEDEDWLASARFVDKDGKAVKGLTAAISRG
jgi:hypothetical protein